MILPNSKVAILALFGFAAVEVQGESMAVGTCAAVAKGDTNSAAGVHFPIGKSGGAAKKGTPAPEAGFWCAGCSMLDEDDVGTPAPSAGKFWTDPNADPVTVAAGTKSTAPGLFCPDGKMCKMAAKGTTAEEDGYAFNLGEMSYVKDTGTAAPGVGMFCPGCMITEDGSTADVAGHWWASAAADPVTVAAGSKADAAGLFCPCASGGGSGDSGGGSSAGYDYTAEQKKAAAEQADKMADAAEAEQAKAEKELADLKASGTASDADIKAKEAEVEAKTKAAEGMRTTADKAAADAEGDKKGSEADAAVPVAHATIFSFVACAMSLLAQC